MDTSLGLLDSLLILEVAHLLGRLMANALLLLLVRTARYSFWMLLREILSLPFGELSIQQLWLGHPMANVLPLETVMVLS